jgi:hypothetical protein
LSDRDATVKYVAVLPHVREITLLGTSDPAYWKDRLAGEEVIPTDFSARAHVLVSGIESRFMGVRFREISICVFAHRDEAGVRRNGLFLAQAFNSSRFFAIVERVKFSTPYRYGRIRIDVALPASITLSEGSDVALRVAMADDSPASQREPLRVGDDGWEGPIFLPRKRRGRRAAGKWFLAKVGGHTRVYPFLPSRDAVTVGPGRSGDALPWISESGFSGQEWSIREDSAHGRTKTFG